MPRRRRRRRATRVVQRPVDALDLVMGPDEFSNPDERQQRAAWEWWRDELMGRYARRGCRPWAWWVFEAGEDRPRPDDELARLLERGELDDAEMREVLAFADRYGTSVSAAARAANVVRAHIGSERANDLMSADGRPGRPLERKGHR
jgi:hypothetical protein